MTCAIHCNFTGEQTRHVSNVSETQKCSVVLGILRLNKSDRSEGFSLLKVMSNCGETCNFSLNAPFCPHIYKY